MLFAEVGEYFTGTVLEISVLEAHSSIVVYPGRPAPSLVLDSLYPTRHFKEEC